MLWSVCYNVKYIQLGDMGIITIFITDVLFYIFIYPPWFHSLHLQLVKFDQNKYFVGYLMSCLSPDVNIALLIVPIVLIPVMLFGGFYLNTGYVSWMWVFRNQKINYKRYFFLWVCFFILRKKQKRTMFLNNF